MKKWICDKCEALTAGDDMDQFLHAGCGGSWIRLQVAAQELVESATDAVMSNKQRERP